MATLTTSSADNHNWIDSFTKEYDSLHQMEMIQSILIQEYKKIVARF